MTTAQLFDLLERSPLAFAAEFGDDDSGPIRAWVQHEPPTDGEDGRVCLCPLTAAHYLKTGELLALDKYDKAGAALRLPSDDVEAIASSADAFRAEHAPNQWRWRKDLRARLETLTKGATR